MKIGVIGATGMAGSAIMKQGQEAGFEMTAIARNEEKIDQEFGKATQRIVGDIFKIDHDQLAQFDVLVDAFATAPDQAYLHVDLATRLVAMFRNAESPRIFFILGAGSLHTGSDSHLVYEELKRDPQAKAYISIPENQLDEYRFLQTVKNVNWVGVSPSKDFHAGPVTRYVRGANQLLMNFDGESVVNSGTLASAVIDEIKNPRYIKKRFTVVNQ